MLRLNNDSSRSMTGSEYDARSLRSLKQTTSRRYDSSSRNPKQWSPDVNMLLSTSRWLEVSTISNGASVCARIQTANTVKDSTT